MKPKKRKGDVNRMHLGVIGQKRHEIDIAKRETTLVECDKELVKREAVIAAVIRVGERMPS